MIGIPTIRLVNPLDVARDGLRWLGTAAGRQQRRQWVSPDGRAHIEVRGAHRPEGVAIGERAKQAIEELEGVRWAEMDAAVGRLIIMFDPENVTSDDLIETIETIEDLHEAGEERFPHDRPDHPADVEPIQRNLLAIAADVGGLGVAATGQALRLARIPTEVSGAISLVNYQPRIRSFVEQGLGPPATDLAFAGLNAVAQGLSQGPLGLVVDIATRSLSVREQQARRSTWERREPQLVEGRHSVGHAPEEFPARPAALPKGPIEQYADRAAIGSLGAAAAVLGVTRSPRRATKLLLTGVPKAASMGREAFAAHFDRAMSGHDVITMDPAALRRLDRVDTLVLEADIMASDVWAIAEVVSFPGHSDVVDDDAWTRRLFNPNEPTAERRRKGWSLGPLRSSDRTLPRGAVSRGRSLGVGGLKVLGLWHHDQLQALVSVQREPKPLAFEILKEARDADLDVLLSGGNNALAQRLDIDRRLVATRIASELDELQRAGRVVMMVGSAQTVALRSADIGLGIIRPGRRIPWTAHLVMGPGLENAWRIIGAIPAAREVSRRSVMIALAGASTGGVWSMFGPVRTAAERSLLPINTSAVASLSLGALAGAQAANRRPPRSAPDQRWHEMDADESLEQLGSGLGGLDADDRAHRQAHSTAREKPEPVGLARAAFDELANPLTPLLGLGAALSAAVGSVTDAALITTVLGANALVGAGQRVQTERLLQRLEHTSDVDVLVRTEGTTQRVPWDSLVAGDVIELDTGDRVPADCRLITADGLEADESSLTGESLPVAKTIGATPGAPLADRSSMLFEGTAVAAGVATAVVVAVGADTEAERSLASGGEPPPSGVEQRLGHLTRMTMPVSIVGGALVTGLGFLRRQPTRDAVGSGVSLMVAAVPEGLPTLATMAQIASARRLAERGALVRNPRSLEALGRVDQICFDKTGTLTQNSISLAAVFVGEIEEQVGSLDDAGRAVVAAAARATPMANGEDILPDAIDRATVEAAAAEGIGDQFQQKGWRRVDEIPFESRRGYHAVLGANGHPDQILSVKGAPERVFSLCDRHRTAEGVVPLDDAARLMLDIEVDRLGRRGLRVLAVAEARVKADSVLDLDLETGSQQLELLGFLAFADLVRPSAAAALREVAAAGVNIAMITGDHASTAEAIAAEVGILNGGTVLLGTDLDQMTDETLDATIGNVAVFARVTPLQKVRVVEAYQRIGRSVAMTGDGVNDASAIRLADAGIALGSGAAAAKSVADLVVTDDRIETIIEAIIEGRAMWESVRSAVAILVGGNLGEVSFVVAGTALTGKAPVNARQLLLVNLLTDMAPALAIALSEPTDRNPQRLLSEGPDDSLGDALTREIALRAATTASGAGAAWAMARMTGTPTRASTVALAALVGTQLGQTLVAGGRSPMVAGASIVSTGILVAAIQTPGVSQFFGCRPLGPIGWVQATGASVGATGASLLVPNLIVPLAGRIIRRATPDMADVIDSTAIEAPKALA